MASFGTPTLGYRVHMTDTHDEMNPHPMPTDGQPQPDGPSTAGAHPTDPQADPSAPASPPTPPPTEDVDAQAPGLYVDSETGPVPEPNEPA